MKKVAITTILSVLTVLTYGQANDYPTTGSPTIYDYSPKIILKRNAATGGFIQGIQTQLQDGTNNWFFGGFHGDSWIVSRGDFQDPKLTILSNGKVGIGTSNPGSVFGETFSINGTTNILAGNALWFSNPGNTNAAGIKSTSVSSLGASDLNLYGGAGIGTGIFIQNEGNVGIGNTSPSEKLEVNGRIKAGDRIYANSTDVNTLSLLQANNSAGGPSILRSYSGTSYWDFAASQDAGGNSLFIGQGMDVSVNNAAIAILSNKNVGIGTNDPKEYKLAVNGKIRAHEIKVETASWPDYVFAKDYQLPTLQETEEHIKEKGHLPGIPSATEVKANGIDLGEMNAKLLQKIEELTLHLIEMKKENVMLQKEVNEIKAKLK